MIASQKHRRLVSILVAGACSWMAESSLAEVPQFSWKTDCVGRMQIGLPGEADVAASPQKEFLDYAGGRGPAYPGAAFSNGQRAFSATLSFMGSVVVSHPVDEMVRKQFLQAAEREKSNDESTLKQRRGISVYGYPATFESLSTGKQRGLAWKIGPSYSAYFDVGGSGFSWGIVSSAERSPALAEYYKTLTEGVSARPLHTVPSDPGVCLPYAFIRDDGTHGRKIETTYQLRDHPDITIWLRDQGALRVRKDRNPDLYTATGRLNWFWTQYFSGERTAIRSAWHESYKKIKLPAGKGVESFVEMTREDGTQDFGYLLVIRGEPDAKDDRPDLTMYVIRDAANAKAKGVEAVSKEQVLEMGRAVAASIRHRTEGVETPSK